MPSTAEQPERRIPGSLITSRSTLQALASQSSHLRTSGQENRFHLFKYSLFCPLLLNQHRPLLSLPCGCLCKMKKQSQRGGVNRPRSPSSSYTSISLRTCVKCSLKQTAPASSVWAKTQVWPALPSRMVTRGLIDEADDTWKALAALAAVSPAVPRPP